MPIGSVENSDLIERGFYNFLIMLNIKIRSHMYIFLMKKKIFVFNAMHQFSYMYNSIHEILFDFNPIYIVIVLQI